MSPSMNQVVPDQTSSTSRSAVWHPHHRRRDRRAEDPGHGGNGALLGRPGPDRRLKPVLREDSPDAAVQDLRATLNKLSAKGMPSQQKIAMDGISG